MRRYFIAVPSLAMAVSACMNDKEVTGPFNGPESALSAAQSATTGTERPERRLRNSFFARTDTEVFQYGARSDSVFSVGIRRPGEERGVLDGRWLVTDQERLGRLRTLKSLTGVLDVNADSALPRLFVKAAGPDVIRELRGLPFVDYVEPRKLPAELLTLNSFGGCGTTTGGVNFVTDVTGDELPTSFSLAKVDRAWAYANGDGVLLGILDTGVNPANSQLASWAFASGLSTGRTHTQTSTIGSGAIGQCAHGTYMAAVAAAPRNGHGAQGVAWKASLLSITVETGVLNVFATDVTQGVLDATSSSARVIVMALGVVFHSSALSDAIQRATALHDILVVAAAGTSYAFLPWHSWFVVYPASMSEVLAVSAADYSGQRDSKSHSGAELDLVAYSPTTTASYDGNARYDFGNSSNATAITAGVAALVRSRYPHISADSVRKRLLNTAGTSCGAPTSFGPIINAEAAVGGICVPNGKPTGTPTVIFDKRIYGDTRTSATETYCIYPTGGAGPVRITWGNGSGANCRTATFVRGSYTQRVTVELQDHGVTLGPVTYFIDVQVTDLDVTCPTCF